MTQTKLGNQVLLDGVQCSFSYQKRAHFWSASKAKDKHDSARFRRLKEIAQDNRNHRQSINFNIGEMQTRRWYDSSHSENVLEWFFRTTSDYGRSFVLPLLWLALSFLMFATIYCIAATGNFSSFWQKIAASVAFSFGQAFPFIPVSRTARINGESALFCNNISETIIGVAALQGVISVLLLFLFGLALRNQFKV
ncbi:hypothetical protein [Parasphingorhabdus sp.]|uniref:hypothetical protein n=1 Tax=Parasphingorhabdus sp. TaxID=2709688 RepID=UPI00300260E8